MRRGYRIAVVVFVVAILMAMSFAAGVTVQRAAPGWSRVVGVEPPAASDLGERVEEVEWLLDQDALTPTSEESKTAGAISGLLRSLDDTYAAYFDPRHWEYFQEQNDGAFFGIGITISQRGETVYVVSVIKGTPAEEAGIQADDEIRSIDGDTKEAWDIDEVVRRIRGPEGTTVEVGVFRPDSGETQAYTIERARIDIPNVEQRMEGDVGYLRLLAFNQQSAEELRSAIGELEGEGARAFVLDVRDNPGGLLQSSVDVASLFVADGVIVRVESRVEPVEEYRASGKTATDKPLVMLVNGNSASASEVLGGALQDHGRAKLVGEQTFGKAAVQTVEPLTFGGGIKFTIAHYLTPNNRLIDGVGLTPDVELEMDPVLQQEPETDTQLQRALAIARDQS
ncbi:MAG: S41 family peptidase [Coriobacteriia bacterium]|nr:S41 family peptidase [Coriobacteriia bacterium]